MKKVAYFAPGLEIILIKIQLIATNFLREFNYEVQLKING